MASAAHPEFHSNDPDVLFAITKTSIVAVVKRGGAKNKGPMEAAFQQIGADMDVDKTEVAVTYEFSYGGRDFAVNRSNVAPPESIPAEAWNDSFDK